ncbi:hypothetical protein Barb4_01268 [Bacteroidales bacterium Barb4]|nr:hypothetical protein Barb4_01268 [Bacteroidales bacterium Barb4]
MLNFCMFAPCFQAQITLITLLRSSLCNQRNLCLINYPIIQQQDV